MSEFLVYSLFNGEKKLRYRIWYRTFFVFIYILIILDYRIQLEGIIAKYFPLINYTLSFAFVISVFIIWILLKMIFIIFNIDDKIDKLLKKYGSSKILEQRRGFSNYLIWPYYISNFTIFKRPGTIFLKNLTLFSIIIINIVYFVSIKYLDTSSIFYIQTPIGLLLNLILIEFFIYLSGSFDTEKISIDDNNDNEEYYQFYSLYKRYTDKEKGFYDDIIVAFIKNNLEKNKYESSEDKKEYIESYITDFAIKEKHFIVSSSDVLISIPKFSGIFFETLKKGGNVLILVDIPKHTKFNPVDVGIENLNSEMQSVTKIFSYYLQETIIKTIPSSRKYIDIGYYSKSNLNSLNKNIVLCNINDATDEGLMKSNWIKDLDLVVSVQFDDTIENNLLLKRKLSLQLKNLDINSQFVFFKPYHTGGDEALTNTFMTKINPDEVKLLNTSLANKNFFINFAYENSFLNLSKIFERITYEYDFSPGMELSVFAIKENVNHIHYFEGYKLDYIQSKNKLASSRSLLKENTDEKYDYKTISQIDIKSSIVINNLPFIIRDFDKHPYCRKKHLSVIFDTENNAPKIYQKYRHLGNKENFVNIISKPHLFREYFANNIDFFVDNPVEAIEPQLSKANINLCLQLFYLLKNDFTDIETVKYLLDYHSIELNGETIIRFLIKIFDRYLHLNITKNSILKIKKEYKFSESKYEEIILLKLDIDSFYTETIFENIADVKIVDSGRNLIMSIPKYLLFQNILPQQNIIINGTSFEYSYFDENNNELVLIASATDNYTFYKPLAKIEFNTNEEEPIDNEQTVKFIVNNNDYNFSLNIYEREATTYFLKYYTFKNHYNSIKSKNSPQFIQLDDKFKNISKRKYITRYIKLKWELSDNFKGNKSELTTYLHNLIYEFLPILFPYKYKYLHVVSDNKLNKNHRDSIPWIFTESNYDFVDDNYITILIVEDSFSDLGLLKALKAHFKYIIKNLYDLLKWMNNKNICFNGSFMSSITGKEYFLDKLKFIKYGLVDEQNIKWNLELLLNFFETNSFYDAKELDINSDFECKEDSKKTMVECDYCGKEYKISEVEIVEDGLHRCISCSENAIDTFEQANKLKELASKFYKDFLNFDIDELDFKFNFVTATELHRYYNKPFYITNKFDQRTAIGLAMDRDIDVILVEKFLKKPQTLSIIIHEIMHIIQFQKLNYFKIKYKEPKLIEGMTTWTEWYILSNSKNQEFVNYAKTYKDGLLIRDDEYGDGFKYVIDKYGKDKKAILKIFKKYAL